MGSYKHYTQGNLDLRMALALAPMAIVGGFAGWIAGGDEERLLDVLHLLLRVRDVEQLAVELVPVDVAAVDHARDGRGEAQVGGAAQDGPGDPALRVGRGGEVREERGGALLRGEDRKSTRLNSSHRT